jgi:hypothetical protein
MAARLSAILIGRALLPINFFFCFFYSFLSKPQGLVRLESCSKLKKKSIHLIGYRPRDLLACSIVPQPLRYLVSVAIGRINLISVNSICLLPHRFTDAHCVISPGLPYVIDLCCRSKYASALSYPFPQTLLYLIRPSEREITFPSIRMKPQLSLCHVIRSSDRSERERELHALRIQTLNGRERSRSRYSSLTASKSASYLHQPYARAENRTENLKLNGLHCILVSQSQLTNYPHKEGIHLFLHKTKTGF